MFSADQVFKNFLFPEIILEVYLKIWNINIGEDREIVALNF